MKELDYGRDYRYADDLEGRVEDMECLPAGPAGRRYYHPTNEGREKLMAQRMDEIAQKRSKKRSSV
jgi:putative ATPase